MLFGIAGMTDNGYLTGPYCEHMVVADDWHGQGAPLNQPRLVRPRAWFQAGLNEWQRAPPQQAGPYLGLMTMTTKNTNAYTSLFQGWATKQLGPKPDDATLALVHGLGLRPGKQALANAMALRAEGVTGAQIVMATGAPQLNRMRGLVAAGHFKREMVSANDQGHTVYKMTVTPKGQALIKKRAEAQAKAALDASAPKPAKAKATKKATSKRSKPAVTAPAQVEPAPQGDQQPAA